MVFTALPHSQIPVGRISFRARTLVVPRPLRRRQNPNPAGAFVGFPHGGLAPHRPHGVRGPVASACPGLEMQHPDLAYPSSPHSNTTPRRVLGAPELDRCWQKMDGRACSLRVAGKVGQVPGLGTDHWVSR